MGGCGAILPEGLSRSVSWAIKDQTGSTLPMPCEKPPRGGAHQGTKVCSSSGLLARSSGVTSTPAWPGTRLMRP